MPYRALQGETISFRGHDGFQSEAYFARPLKRDAFPASSSSITCPAGTNGSPTWCGKFAHHGYAAMAPNLFVRFGPGDPDDVAARARPAGGAYDAEVMGDVAGLHGAPARVCPTPTARSA